MNIRVIEGAGRKSLLMQELYQGATGDKVLMSYFQTQVHHFPVDSYHMQRSEESMHEHGGLLFEKELGYLIEEVLKLKDGKPHIFLYANFNEKDFERFKGIAKHFIEAYNGIRFTVTVQNNQQQGFLIKEVDVNA